MIACMGEGMILLGDFNAHCASLTKMSEQPATPFQGRIPLGDSQGEDTTVCHATAAVTPAISTGLDGH